MDGRRVELRVKAEDGHNERELVSFVRRLALKHAQVGLHKGCVVALGHTLKPDKFDCMLLRFLKPLETQAKLDRANASPKQAIRKVVHTLSEETASGLQRPPETVPQPPPQVKGKMNLPPVWRVAAAAAEAAAAAAAAATTEAAASGGGTTESKSESNGAQVQAE